MNKYQEATTFYNHFIRLSDAKKEEFSRLSNRLLSINYLCAAKEKDKDDYYQIVANFDLFSSFFSLTDYVLEHHHVDKVINLYNSQNYNRYSFKKNESIVLLLLRKIYFQKMQEVSLSDEINVTLQELHEALMITGIFEKRLNKSEMREILRVLKRFNIIDLSGGVDDDNTIIVIYPTICYVLPIDRIEELENRINEYQKRGGISEEISEDEID